MLLPLFFLPPRSTLPQTRYAIIPKCCFYPLSTHGGKTLGVRKDDLVVAGIWSSWPEWGRAKKDPTLSGDEGGKTAKSQYKSVGWDLMAWLVCTVVGSGLGWAVGRRWWQEVFLSLFFFERLA